MKFAAHGRYELTLKGNVIFMKAMGAWNKEAAEKAFDDIRAMRADISSSTFAKLINAQEWILGTPEFQYLTKIALEELVKDGLRCEAYVVGDGSVKREQINLMTPNNPEYARTIVTNTKEAEAWLAKKGFPVT